MLGGRDAVYEVPLPEPGEPCRAILDSYTKELSAEYQARAWIDLAFKLRRQIPDLSAVRAVTIHTSHHTHAVIGTGSNDPQKPDPREPRDSRPQSHVHLRRRAEHRVLVSCP
jgi:2-methylcitrate dehydratase